MIYTVLTVLHIAVAASVSGHVLLTKSDVRSAIGWIGLAWFSPIFGALIYLGFGINRVARRASRIDRRAGPLNGLAETTVPAAAHLGEADRDLAGVGTRVTGLPLTAGNRVTMLCGGNQAYSEMLKAIAEARHSIALATYIFRPDHVGIAFVDALAAARARGVEVRVLVDAIGSGYLWSPIMRALRRADIPVARFMLDRRFWRMPFLNLRNHKKLLILDGATGFAGGLNLGIENTWAGRAKPSVDDTHFFVDGPVVAQMMESFYEDWYSMAGEMLVGAVWWPAIASSGTVIARGMSSGPDEDVGKIEAVLAAALEQARHRIRIVSPYFLPDERLKSAIASAVLRGVDVEVLVPSKSDHVVMGWAMRAHLAFFPVDGMRIFATPAPFDHSKLVTVDGRWCAVGSANWDVRSLRLNFEFMLECFDSDLVSGIDAHIDGKISQATLLTSTDFDRRPLVTKLRDAGARLFLPYL